MFDEQVEVDEFDLLWVQNYGSKNHRDNYIHPTRVLINPHQSGLTVLRVPVVIVLAHVSQAQHIAY